MARTATDLVQPSGSVGRYAIKATGRLVITNTATIAAPGYQTLPRMVTVLVNPRQVYLPLVLRGN